MKKEEEKIEIKEYIPINIDLYNFEGDTNKIIKFFQDIPVKIKEKVDTFRKYYTEKVDKKILEDNEKNHIKWLSCHRYELDVKYYHDDVSLNINGFRWETDEEFNTRLDTQKRDKLNAQKAAKTRKLKQEEEELKLFNKLKEKYGKET